VGFMHATWALVQVGSSAASVQHVEIPAHLKPDSGNGGVLEDPQEAECIGPSHGANGHTPSEAVCVENGHAPSIAVDGLSSS